MAKKKNNKKRDGAISMEFSTDTNLPEAMDTSEATVSKPVLGVGNSNGHNRSNSFEASSWSCEQQWTHQKQQYQSQFLELATGNLGGCTCIISSLNFGNRKIKKAAAMKRSKNLRKMKAIEKGISKSKQSEEKI